MTINVIFTDANTTNTQTAYTDINGTYRVSWKPDSMGLWQVHANIAENASISAACSNSSIFTVTDTFLNQYMLYTIGGVAGVAGVSSSFHQKKTRIRLKPSHKETKEKILKMPSISTIK